MKLNRKWLLVIGLVLSLTMATAGTLAYLTDTQTAENVFTLGKVDIELTEPDWNPDEDHMLMPGIEIPKNPKVQNTGNTDAWVWLEVSIPEELYDLVDLDYSSEWIKGYVNTSGGNKVVTLKWPEKLAPTEFTEEAFTRILLNSAVDNEDLGTLSGVESKIVVKGYAIQGTFDTFKAAYDAYYNNGNGHEPEGTPAQNADELKDQLTAGGNIVYTGSDDVVIDENLTLTGDTTLHLSNTDLKFEDGAKIETNGFDLTITDAKIVGGETAFEVGGDSVITLGEGATIAETTAMPSNGLFNIYGSS